MGQFKAAAMLTPAFCRHQVVNRLPTHHNSFKARENNEVVVGRLGPETVQVFLFTSLTINHLSGSGSRGTPGPPSQMIGCLFQETFQQFPGLWPRAFFQAL